MSQTTHPVEIEVMETNVISESERKAFSKLDSALYTSKLLSVN